METGLVLLVALGLVLAYGAFVYNGLVAMRQRVTQAASDIEVQLLQRRDLVPSLVETVRGYAGHERGTLEAVIAARGRAVAAEGAAGQAAAETGLAGALGRLMMLTEAYPELKADGRFGELQAQLEDLENRIAASRRFLNGAVAEFNAAIEAFPAVLFARSLGFAPAAFHDIGGEARVETQRAPAVSFR